MIQLSEGVLGDMTNNNVGTGTVIVYPGVFIFTCIMLTAMLSSGQLVGTHLVGVGVRSCF